MGREKSGRGGLDEDVVWRVARLIAQFELAARDQYVAAKGVPAADVRGVLAGNFARRRRGRRGWLNHSAETIARREGVSPDTVRRIRRGDYRRKLLHPARTERLAVYLSPAEKRALRVAAGTQTTAAWARQSLLIVATEIAARRREINRGGG